MEYSEYLKFKTEGFKLVATMRQIELCEQLLKYPQNPGLEAMLEKRLAELLLESTRPPSDEPQS